MSVPYICYSDENPRSEALLRMREGAERASERGRAKGGWGGGALLLWFIVSAYGPQPQDLAK